MPFSMALGSSIIAKWAAYDVRKQATTRPAVRRETKTHFLY